MAVPDERSHYQVLGLSRAASADEIRRAHRQLAQLLHPDRQGAAGPAERRLAERRMREVNAAWTVLSDPARRADYDRVLVASTAHVSGAGTSVPPRSPGPGPTVRPEDDEDPDAALARARWAEVDPDEVELSAAHFWLLRRGPVLLVLVVAAVLFVATAYAGGGAGTDPSEQGLPLAPDAGCVLLVEGRNAIGVDCGTDNDGTIVTRVEDARDCPEGSRYALFNNEFVCVRSGAPPTTAGGGG